MATATQSPSHTSVLRRSPLAVGSWLVLIVWLVSSAAAFWYFELSDWRPFASSNFPALSPADTALAQQWFRLNVEATYPGETPKITFVHLYDPACRCNRFIEPHLQRLITRYQSRGVRFVAARSTKSASVEGAPFDVPVIRSRDSMLAEAGITMSPAALLFDADGRLVYYGPYSDSAWCGSAGALVDTALLRALSGNKTLTELPASRGCFCE